MKIKIVKKGVSLLDCKRGQYLQLMFFMVVFLVAALVFVASNMAGNKINDMIQADPNMDSQAKGIMQDNVNAQPLVFDAGAGLVLVAVWLVCLALAYNAPSNPLLLVTALLIIASLGFAGMLLSNTWDAFYTDAGISPYASNFTMTNFLLQNYLIVILVMGFSTLMVALYRQGNG